MGHNDLRRVERRNVDIDIGVHEPVYSVAELLRLAQDAIKRKDYTCAHGYLERASGSPSGMLHYAAFLMEYPPTSMKKGQREATIEEMLLYVEKNSPASAPKARAMLIDFYHRFSDRPLRRLGFLLHAARLGEPADAQVIKNLCRGIADPEIAQPGKDLLGSYLCGTECACYPNAPMRRWARMFLSTVAESDSSLAGPAALQLADLLQEDATSNQAEISYWYRRASECGNPELLRK